MAVRRPARHRRQAEKHVRTNDGGIRGHELTLIVFDDELRLSVAERIDERDLIAHHVERLERRGIRAPGSVPANRAPIPSAVRRDDVVPGVGERRHHFAPAVGQVRKAMKQQCQRPSVRPCLEHVDGVVICAVAAADAIATPPSAEAPARSSRAFALATYGSANATNSAACC
jgi:hypothetical protein